MRNKYFAFVLSLLLLIGAARNPIAAFAEQSPQEAQQEYYNQYIQQYIQSITTYLNNYYSAYYAGRTPAAATPLLPPTPNANPIPSVNPNPNPYPFPANPGQNIVGGISAGQVTAGVVMAPTPSPTPTPTPTLMPTPTPGISKPSGIKGLVTISPVCNPKKDPTEPCAKPYQSLITVKTQEGDYTAGTVYSDKNGVFKLDLAPGVYKVVPYTVKPYPTTDEQTVIVSNGLYTDIVVSYDSGKKL